MSEVDRETPAMCVAVSRLVMLALEFQLSLTLSLGLTAMCVPVLVAAESPGAGCWLWEGMGAERRQPGSKPSLLLGSGGC